MMALSQWEEQGYHVAGMIITFCFAWLGICVAITIERCSQKATSLLNLFAGGGMFITLIVITKLYRSSIYWSSAVTEKYVWANIYLTGPYS